MADACVLDICRLLDWSGPDTVTHGFYKKRFRTVEPFARINYQKNIDRWGSL
jgi:hypothetical protein